MGIGASGRQLRPEDTEADGEADAEDDSISEVTTESIRPRPQGSSPVYEYCIEDEYFNKKLQQDIENRQRKDSTFKMSDSQESMEVTLQTDVESGASGFSVAGGGADGIFVKQVLKESPASNLFSLREGDQLLSATIFFDNIKYEDALKILQYSEPYKVQFNLKRKFVGKDELEAIHSVTQSKKEKLSQGMDTMEISEKTISEEDKAKLIVKQRVGRPKRTKKDRLSWPKFQSIKGKKILGHRRSRSTSDAYEHGIPDVSPTSTDTESQFQPEEIHGKVKKQSQKKLKFPTIGFKMHKSKQEPYEINPFKEYENATAVELSEVMTKEYTSLDVDRKSKEKEPKRGVSDTVFPLPQHTRKYPDVELTITKSKEKKLKSNIEFTKQEHTVTTTQMKTAVIQTKDITDSQIKVSQNIPKTRKKKQKDSKVQIETQYQKEDKGKEINIASKYALPQTEASKVETDIKIPKMDFSLPKVDHKATKPEIKMGEITADINISEFDVKATAGQEILELKKNITSDEIRTDGSAITLEDDESRFKMLKLQMPRFEISLPKQKDIPQGELSISTMEADFPKTGLKTELKTAKIEADDKLTEVEIEAPTMDVEIGEKGKIKMPALKMPSVKVAKLKAPEEGISLPKVEVDDTLPKGNAEVSVGAAAVKLPEAEGIIDRGELTIHKPKFKMPSMGFSKPDIKGPKIDVDVSTPKVDVSHPEAELHVEKPEVKGGDITISSPDVKIPTGSASLEFKTPEVDVEAPSGKVSVQGPDLKLESGDRKFQMPKFHMPKFGISQPKGKGIPQAEISIPSVEADLPKTELKAEVTLPTAKLETDLKLPQVEVDAPSLDMDIGDKSKIKMPEVKMPSVKVPKLKGPEIGVTLPKVETDITLPKGKAEVSVGAATVKLPEAEGTIEGGELKIHKPKFKMPSMGFSKPDIKGPKIDVDVSMPKVDVSHPEAELHVEKPEVKGGDITISSPDIKIPKGSASLELKAPEVDVEAPSGKVSVQGPDLKLESGDRKFQMPKFHMPKFGISLPKGKGIPEGEISIPSVEAELPKSELKAEVTLPSAELETDLKLPQVEVDAPSLDMDIGDKSKIKMPEVKMPSVKVPKLKGPEVAVTLPKVETDITLPKGKAEVSVGAAALKLPEAEGIIDRGELKIHKPKFKMPSMGFSKPDIKGPKIDVDVSTPKVDVSHPEAEFHVEKPEVKGGDITISSPDVKIPTGSASLEFKTPEVDVEAPSGKVSVQGPDLKLESGDRKFQMPKFHMPKFGISVPKGKGIPEAEISVPSVEAELPKTELKAEVSLPSAKIETDLKLPQVEVDAPSLDVDIGDKGKIKMPEVKMPSVKVPKLKGPEIGVTLPKVETDITLPKGKAEVSVGAATVKLPEAEGTIEGGELKIHKPKFKMPSMGFSKSDIKGPKIDVDVSMPKVDVYHPEAELHVEKPEVKGGDITISSPDIKIPKGSASLELKAPEVDVEAPSGKVSVQGPDLKLESGDRKFQMPKFHMPKFGISVPKGKGIPEAEISIPSVEAELPKTELKAEVSLPSAKIETDLKLPQVEVDAPSLDVDIGDKGKIKMPEVKMPSVKVPKLKGPEIGVTLPKVETDITLPKGKAEVSVGAATVKLPEVEGTIEGGELKIHKPKFKMPSMGFSKSDIKGPKIDVDVSMPKVDVYHPEAELHVEKPEVKGGDITISSPDIKIPKGSASLELKAPEVDVEAPSGKVSVQGPDLKLESGDRKFQMPKFHMPKFGISLPKGKGIPEGEISVPSVEAELPKSELKAEVTLPSAEFETDLKLPQVEVDAPSLDVDIGDKGKIKMPEVKMPSVKVPKLKGPEVAVTLPKVETDITLPKGKAEVSVGAATVKLPEAEGIIDRGELKIHKPKFKMSSMGFSKPDIKGPKIDVDVSTPKVDVSLPEAELHVEKPEVKGGDITISAPDVKIPMGSASLELKAPEVDVDAPSEKVSMQGPDLKLESGDKKFQMPKFHMPKFGISLPKGKGIPEAEINVPSVEAELRKTELKAEVTLPSAKLETDLKLPQVEVDAPHLDIEVGDKGKIKMPEVKMPSVKVPKLKGPDVGVTLPKVETDITLPKGKAEVSVGAVAVKLPEAEGTIEGGGLKIYKPKFKMPSMGFSKPDIKGPKIDVDVSMPKVDVSHPEAEFLVEKPEVKGGDIIISAPDVKIPTGSTSLEFKTPEVDVEAPSGKVSVQGPDLKLESGDRKFQMPKFHMPKFGISQPKGKGIPEGEINIPSVEEDLPKTELKAEVTLPSAKLETDLKLPQVEVYAPSLDVDIGDKGKIKMPEVKMPSVKVPKVKGPEVGVTLPKVETDITLPKGKGEVSVGTAAVKLPEAEGTIDGGGLKIHKPKFKMPSMGFSKPDIKGPKIDVDVSMPKMDVSLPEAELHIEKPEVKGGDITISAPDLKIPMGSDSLELKAPEVDVEAPSGKVSLQGPDLKLESRDRKFQMPKFQMPQFGTSLHKGKDHPEVEITVPSIEAIIPQSGLEITMPSAVLEADIKLPKMEAQIPTLEMGIREKSKIKMPLALQQPEITLEKGDTTFKIPKFHMPKFGISVPQGKGVPDEDDTVSSVEVDFTKTELKREVTLPSVGLQTDIKVPDLEVVDPRVDMEVGDEGKIKMPGLKMPSIKVPKLKGPEVGISLPKVEADVTLPKGKAEVSDGSASIKLPEAEGTIEGGGLKIHMPHFKMPSMGSSKPDIKGPKVDVDVSMPKVDISLPKVDLHADKPEIKGDITISAPQVKIPIGSASQEFKAPDVDSETPSRKVFVQGPDVMPEIGDTTFKISKFRMPKFGISLPKGKGIPEAEISVPSVEAKLPKTEFKAEVTLPSAELETDLKLPQVEVDAPSLDMEIGEKGKIKMPEVKMPSVKVPKLKGPEVGVTLPKVKTDITLPKGKDEVSLGAATVKLPEAEGTIDGGGLKIHKPKVKMPSMGFSKPDIKGPKIDVDFSMPKLDLSRPEVELHVEKPEVKGGDITISAPDVKIPTGSASLELKTPKVDVPSGKVSVQGPDLKLESGDKKFQMPKFHMPKFGISLPKGKGIPEAEISVPSVEAELPKTELRAEVTLPSAELETDLKFPQVEVDAPSFDVDIGDKGKIKMPEVKMPSVKVPKLKGPDVGVTLPKVETDITLPKGKDEVSVGAAAVKLPEAEGTIEGGGLKIHMPKFKMPSMGFSKPDIKGPKIDVDVSMPKVDFSHPEVEFHVEKPEVKGGDITISSPDVKIPTGSASLEFKTPEVDVEAPSGKVSVQGPDLKLESGDRKFQMPKFHMPKFGISLPKGKGIPEGETSVPSVEAELPKTELKAEVTLPSAEFETDLKLPQVEADAPSLDVDIGVKGKIKMPEVKMPSVKVPKLKGPEVGVTLPKVETDITLPKGKAEWSVGAAAVKLPEAEGTIDGGGQKIHKPKVKMPSMGFSKPDIKGPKIDVDVSMPKLDLSRPEVELHVEKPEVKGGDITISAPDVKIPTGSASLELKTPKVDVEAPSGKISVQGPDLKLESGDRKFQMPKFHMPKFGISLPKGKGIPEGEISIPSVEAELPKTELKAEVTLPSAELETDLKLPQVEVDAPSFDVDIGDKGKIKMPEVKMPSVKVPKLKGPDVGVTLPKVETDITLPKGKDEVSVGATAVKLPEAEGTIEGGGLKIHMPKFKMPSMGFSKPDIKGPKIDVDVSMPKVDFSRPEVEFHVVKPEGKGGDITISSPDVKIPTGSASLEFKTPEVDIEAPSGKISVQGPDLKLESGDRKFQMPKFHMPKFGISLPKGKGIPEAEISIPSVEAELPKTDLKAEVTLPSAELETDLKLPQVEVDAPSLDVDIGDKGKIKMPEVKMPSVKVPKLKGPELGVTLPKVETDITLPKGKAEVSVGAVAVKLPEAEGTIEGGGLKIQKPKFKMPSMGFSKPDIKGPKIDVDVSMPKVDLSRPDVELHVEKPEVKGGDITISAPEVKIPTGSASLELKAPDVDLEASSGKVSVQGSDLKLESGDRKFQMPKFHMPKFGISLPKGKGIPQAEISVPSVEAELPKTELKAEVTLPSAEFETDLKLPQVEVDAPSLDVDIGDKGKIKMPEVKMPSIKVPKLKEPEVGVTLPKVETDITLPKGKAEVSVGAATVKLPEAEGTIEGGGLKIHMPKFKMPSMGFSKPDIKGPKIDVDVSMPKLDLSRPEVELHVEKPEVKGGDIAISAPDVKIPTGSASLELKTPKVDVEAPSGKVSVQGSDIKLESGDRKFQMPKFHMPKFGISLPKGKGIPEAEISIPSVEAELPKTELKAEVTLPSSELETDLKLPQVEVDAPSLDVDIGDKGKIKMPEVKMPSVKVPKLKGPEVAVTLPKVETDITLPKGKAEVSVGAATVKLPEAEGIIDGGGLNIHKPKFKMPSMGFSKPDIKGPKIDVDVSMPKVDVSLPEAELHVGKPVVKGGDATISAPDVKIPTGSASLELKAPEVDLEAPSGKVSVQGPDLNLQSRDRKFQMPKFHMPKFGISLPKGKAIPEAEICVPSVEAELPKTEFKAEVSLPSAQLATDLKLPQVEVDAPSLDVEIGDKSKIKMPEMKMPSVEAPKLKRPEVGISLPKVESDVTLPKGKAEVPDAAAVVKLPEAEGTIGRGGLKIHKPKFKMPGMGFSKTDIKGPKIDGDFSMPKADVSLPEADLSPAKPELKLGKPMCDIDISVPEIIIPTGQDSLEVRSPHPEIEPPSSMAVHVPDVQLESGDSKFKMPKFQMPKVGISRPKGKGFSEGEITPSMEGDLPKTGLKMEFTLPSSELKADITLPEVDREAPSLDVEVEEKGKVKAPGVKLPSVKAPKLTAPEVGISLPKVEADFSLPKGKAELPDSESASKVEEAEGSREKGRMKIHMPKFKMPSMGFSKSDIKGPKIDSDASMPDVHTSLPNVELSTTKLQLKADEFEGDIRIAAPEVKIPWVPVTVELQAPDVEVQASSGKVPDIALGLSKDVDVPQLKTTMDVIDIAVETPTLEMESDVLGEKKDVLEQKIKMSQIIRADVKTAAVGIPSVDISVAQSEVSTQDLHGAAKEPEAKGQITKRGSLDGEEKGHFKMPKFKLPSLSWSPKKEASLKTSIKEPVEESHLGIVSDDAGTEPKVTISEDQGVHTDGNVDIATKKGQVKRSHLIMPKISLSKTKVPKAEVDIVVEGDGALVQIPDIESSFTTRKVEETEISVKMLKGEIKEIKTFQTDTDISLPKVSMTKSSFEQKCLETEVKGDICMDNASMKSDGTEGEFRMPKLKMPKFGISDLPESEISDLSGSGITSSKPESDASQFQMTTEFDEPGEKAQLLQVKSDEGISEEIQTEESQSWFKMPKFKMPSFGRTSKAKKSDAETEDITGEAHVTELQVDVKYPEVVTISRELDSEKNISEQKVMLPQDDVRAQKEQQSTTDQLVGEGSFLQSSEKIGRKPSDLEAKTYADIVKDGAEGQSSHTEFIGTIPKMDIDSNIPKSEMTIQQPEVIPDTMIVAEIPSTEITMGKKIDATITDPESLDTQPEKKSPKKDSQGKESIFKMPTFSVPLFGWSTTKSNAIVPGIESDLEDPAVTLSKVKMDVSITDEDFEIIDFPVEGFEKDLPKESEVKAEEKEKTSKTKASKFKIPKFANLRSKSQGIEIPIDSSKEQTVSLVRPEGETSEIQVQDKKPGDAEESFQMPKFKMLKFTHRISEGEKLTSEETMDIKDTADDNISQLQFKAMFPEEKGDDIQKSKVRITTLSEPAIQRPQIGSKFQSTDSSFVDTTVYVHQQVPKEFSAEFLKEKIETMDGNVQKSIAKITTLKEPDIQRAPLEIKLQPDEPFSSSAPVQVKGSIAESKEIKMESKSTFGCGDVAEIQESFSTQIVKESEIPPSDVQTAAFGFSLLKVKIQESHVSLDVPVKLSSTKCMGEIFEDKDHQLSGTGEAAQKAGLSEVKQSDKDKDIIYEYIEGTSSAVGTTPTTLKSFTIDIQSSSEFAECHSESIEISKSAIETAEETTFISSTEEVTDEKDSKRSGRFKLWFPSIGFSPTTDDTTSDSKPEAQQKVQPDDSSKLDSDTAKETEKTGWFKFPKLGFSSPTKKNKEEGKEKETDSKERKGEGSPTDKNETFFDAQETLSLKEKEENETSGDTPSEPIVSSSARTELILLEKGKAEAKPTPEDSSK